MAVSSLESKREVRDHVRQTLQPLVDDGTIEMDELKSVVKSAGDTVSSSLPVDSHTVERAALEELLGVLKAAKAADEVLSKVQQRLAQCQEGSAVAGTNAEQQPPAADGATHGEANPADDGAEAKKASFTFGALKARLAKRKEELQAVSSGKAEAAAAGPTTASTTAPATANVSVNVSVAPSETHKGPSTNTSLGTSPALAPSGVQPDAVIPPAVDLGQRDTTSQDAQAQPRQSSSEAPTQPQAKPEGIVLTASPIIVDDIYAEFVGRGRGRARGGDMARGRGGDPTVRGGGAYRGVGRGGPYGSPYPGPPFYGRGRAPPSYNPTYSPSPLRGGTYGHPYPRPPRGGGPTQPQPPYQPENQPNTFRPY